MSRRIIKDKLKIEDNLLSIESSPKAFKTKIICKDDFGNTLWEEENKTTLGGGLFSLMKIFGIDRVPLDIATVNELLQINDGPRKELKDNFVCLFGIGSGGAGETADQVKEVEVQERTMNKFLPMRVVSRELPAVEQDKYWLRQEIDDGKGTIMYFLKSIQNIDAKVLWKDGAEGEDGSPVGDDVWNTTRTDAIEEFVELTLRIDAKDGVEYFDYVGSTETPSFSELGLFTGLRQPVGNGREDYTDVWLYSKFNIPREIRYADKGFTFYYRIYLMS